MEEIGKDGVCKRKFGRPRAFFLDSAFLFHNKQTSTKTRRATKEPNVWGISTGERSMVWAKFDSGRGGL